MLQRVHIQILDNPFEEVLYNWDESETPLTNRELAEELREEMEYFYPSVVFVEYVDLFLDDEEDFEEIRDMLRLGAIDTPIVLINGVIKVYGTFSPSAIKKEVEKLVSSGPVH